MDENQKFLAMYSQAIFISVSGNFYVHPVFKLSSKGKFEQLAGGPDASRQLELSLKLPRIEKYWLEKNNTYKAVTYFRIEELEGEEEGVSKFLEQRLVIFDKEDNVFDEQEAFEVKAKLDTKNPANLI